MAQLVEQLIRNQQVGGSSPPSSSIFAFFIWLKKLVKVIIFGQIIGVICCLFVVLSGRSQANVNPEPAHNEDNSASEVRIPIDSLERRLNGGNVAPAAESVSPASDVNKTVSSVRGVKRPSPSVDSSQSDISESDEGYSSDDESWSSSETGVFFSDDEAEGRALAKLNESCGYPRDYEEGLNRSEINSLRQYLYRNLTKNESEEDWPSSESGVSLSDD